MSQHHRRGTQKTPFPLTREGRQLLQDGSQTMGIRWDGNERRKGERRQTQCDCACMSCRTVPPHPKHPAYPESEARVMDGNR